MKVTAGWVEKNMGISKETIRYWDEELKLIPKEHYQNKSENKKYRCYDSEDLELLWFIKILRELGCSYKTIKELLSQKELGVIDILSECKKNLSNEIKELEEKLERKKLLLDLTRTIELTGRIPFPNEFGNIKFNDFLKESIEKFNLFKLEGFKELYLITEKAKECDLSNEEIDELINIIESEEYKALITIHILINILGQSNYLDINDVKIIYLVSMIKTEFYKLVKKHSEFNEIPFNKVMKYILETYEFKQEIETNNPLLILTSQEREFVLNAFNSNIDLDKEIEQSLEFIVYKNKFNRLLPIKYEQYEDVNIFENITKELVHFDAKKVLKMNILIGYLKDRFHMKEDSEEIQVIIEMIFENFKDIYFYDKPTTNALRYFKDDFGINTFKIVIPTLTTENINFIKKAMDIFNMNYTEKGVNDNE